MGWRDVDCQTFDQRKKEVKVNKIFVFGSNRAGRHGKGAALYALNHYGAIYGRGVGRQGMSYAIPTKDENLKTLPLSVIQTYIDTFVQYAATHPELEFLLTPIGTGLAGYSIKEIRPLFSHVSENVVFLDSWNKE